MIVHFDSFKRNEQLASITLVFIGNWAAACYNCSWFYPDAGYELWLSQVPAAQVTTESSSSGWIRVTAESILRLTRVPAAGYGLYHGWLEFRKLDKSYSWLHFTADSSSGGWIRLKADSILRLTASCGWFCSAADSSQPAGLDLYFNISRLILQNTSFLWFVFYRLISVTTDPDSGCCFNNLEEAWASFKTLDATDSSCSGGFELRRLIRDLRPTDYLQNFDPDVPWQYIWFSDIYDLSCAIRSTRWHEERKRGVLVQLISWLKKKERYVQLAMVLAAQKNLSSTHPSP